MSNQRCQICNSPQAERIQVPCPDGDDKCLVLHFGYRCEDCLAREASGQRLFRALQQQLQKRVIIAGSRNISDYSLVEQAVKDSGFYVGTIISGGARGVDKLGERYARTHGFPLEVYHADWNSYGRSAGYKRNEEMAKVADCLVAIWDGQSMGTKHMIDIATKRGLLVHVHNLKEKRSE